MTNKILRQCRLLAFIALGTPAWLWGQAKDFTVDNLIYTTLTGTNVSIKGAAEGYQPATLTVPATVSSSGVTYKVISSSDMCFYGATYLHEVVLPEGFQTLGRMSFSNCSNLSQVTLPSSLTSIKSNVFTSCTSLASIELPAGIREIGGNVFQNCSLLNNVKWPAQITKISDYSFNNCTSLTTIEIPEGVTQIGTSAFWGCTALSQMEFPTTITNFAATVFRKCSNLTQLTLPVITPPAVLSTTFYEVNTADVTLLVPQQSLSAYMGANVWKGFKVTAISGGGQQANSVDVLGVETDSTTYANTDVSIPVKIFNSGSNPVSSLVYNYKAGDNTGSAEFNFDTPLEAGVTSRFTASLTPFPQPGVADVEISIVKVNGADNASEAAMVQFPMTVHRPDIIPDDVTAFTYSTGPALQHLGNGEPTYWHVGIEINNPLLVGTQVVGFSADQLPKTRLTRTGGWISTHPMQHGQPANVVEKAAPAVDGTITVAFDQPYTLTQEGAIVGYMMHSPEGYCIPVAPPVGVPGSSWIGDEESMEDYALKYGTTPITVYLQGEMPKDALRLDGVTGSFSVAKDTSFTLTFNVTNMGVNPVTTVGYNYSLNGQTIEGSANVDIEGRLNAISSFDITFPGLETKGDYELNLSLTRVNGNDNLWANASTQAQLHIMGFLPFNRPLFEEATGTWCGWCTRGWIAMKTMPELYPEFIGVAWHNGDAMMITETFPFDNGGSYPKASINRVINKIDPYFGTTGSDLGIYDTYLSMASEFALANLDIVTKWGQDNATLDVTTTAHFAAPASGYKLGYMLVGNKYNHPNEDGWMQNNFYSGQDATSYLAPLVEMPDVIKDFTFDDVVIYGDDASGVEGSLPDEIAEDATVTHNYSFPTVSIKGIKAFEHEIDGTDVEEPWELIEDRANLEVVVFLIDANGNILNARKVRAGEETSAVGNLMDSDDAQVVTTVYYDLGGRRVVNPSNGIYLKQQHLSNGLTRVTKIAL